MPLGVLTRILSKVFAEIAPQTSAGIPLKIAVVTSPEISARILTQASEIPAEVSPKILTVIPLEILPN